MTTGNVHFSIDWKRPTIMLIENRSVGRRSATFDNQAALLSAVCKPSSGTCPTAHNV